MAKKPYDVHISTVLNGWIVKVGCQTVVFTNQEAMLVELKLYLDDPEERERLWLEASTNSRFFNLADRGYAIPEDPGEEEFNNGGAR